jgi:hypothetical protein
MFGQEKPELKCPYFGVFTGSLPLSFSTWCSPRSPADANLQVMNGLRPFDKCSASQDQTQPWVTSYRTMLVLTYEMTISSG